MTYLGFNKLKGQLEARPGVRNPGALTATIGRAKYGKKKMQRAAAAHKSLRHARPKRKLVRARGKQGMPAKRAIEAEYGPGEPDNELTEPMFPRKGYGA